MISAGCVPINVEFGCISTQHVALSDAVRGARVLTVAVLVSVLL